MSFSRRQLIKLAAISGAMGLAGGTLQIARAEGSGTGQVLKMGVIGAGWLGGTVAKLWVKAGHQVMFSTRHLDELRREIAPLGPNARAGTPAEAAAFGDILLFAVPWDALPQLGQQLAPLMKGKIVIDACNPSGGKNSEDGVAESSQKLLPGTRYVRAFSAVDATAIEASASASQSNKLGVPIASDDAAALTIVAKLVEDVGSVPVITGNLASARSFQRGGPGFRANTNAAALRHILGLPASS
ncbi:NADPH-dependent F420 reductase [Pantoea cypripedii]|uniref:NADP oxidoreductase n=1 Tax=Pantoea cypripedii TaxID=55209 RepID=A0A6B9GGH4_PANCY|nr:NAD(P)-binding domain-containing protein [Pantoea cypripedii]QGY32999.1 NADP oxidoreductase [Pantoea cypripedii]